MPPLYSGDLKRLGERPYAISPSAERLRSAAETIDHYQARDSEEEAV
jgi:hypothetical protein